MKKTAPYGAVFFMGMETDYLPRSSAPRFLTSFFTALAAQA